MGPASHRQPRRCVTASLAIRLAAGRRGLEQGPALARHDDVFRQGLAGAHSERHGSAGRLRHDRSGLEKRQDRHHRRLHHVEGEADHNQKLSDQRTQAVCTYLADKGISTHKLVVAEGHGATGDLSHLQQNRRVDIAPSLSATQPPAALSKPALPSSITIPGRR